MTNMLLNSKGHRARTCDYICDCGNEVGGNPGKKGKRPLKHSIKRAEKREWMREKEQYEGL